MQNDELSGHVWAFGDHVNTDVIHPPDYFSLDPAKVKKGLFAKYDPTLQERIEPGDILVGGVNFGCGSSRETSMRSIKLNAIGAIVAVDFARIFFRNATNNGIPCLQLRDPADAPRAARAKSARISLARWTFTTETGDEIALVPASEFIVRIWRAGGLLAMLPSPGAVASAE
jgi:3-isopropylmalate dehydratase small subunit